MNRQDNIDYLNKYLNSMTGEKLGDFGVLPWDSIIPEPPTSDAVFLVNLRKALPEKSGRGVFLGGMKYVWRAAVVCSAVFVLVLSGAKWTQNNSVFFAAGNADVEWSDVTGWVELSTTANTIDPAMLADSLQLSSLFNDWEADADLASDAEIILSLDDEDFEAVLNEIQTMQVFAAVGS